MTDKSQPDYCFVVVPGGEPGKRIAIVKRGERGYYLTDFDDAKRNQEWSETHVRLMNERRGISAAVSQAMLIGSMFGWDVPGARVG